MSFDYPFLNAIAGIFPSPDWFTGFYLFDTVDEYDRTYWERFTIRTYPWDAGTDKGQTYTAEDRDVDQYGISEPSHVHRIFPKDAPQTGVFLTPDKKQILPVGEYSCVLHVCPIEDPDCKKPDWPPANYCDILKYPNCATYCNPAKVDEDTPCEPCKGNGYEPKTVYMHNCCAAGHEPRHAESCEAQGYLEGEDEAHKNPNDKGSSASTISAIGVTAIVMLGLTVFMM